MKKLINFEEKIKGKKKPKTKKLLTDLIDLLLNEMDLFITMNEDPHWAFTPDYSRQLKLEVHIYKNFRRLYQNF